MTHPADAARESARQDDGQFGTQLRPEADVDLAASVDSAACERAGSHQVTTRHNAMTCPVEDVPAQPGRPISPHLGDGLPAWPAHLPAPTFVSDFDEDGELVTQIHTGDRVATFWREWHTDMPDTDAWDSDNGEYDDVYAYGKALQFKLETAYAESRRTPIARAFLGHVIEHAQTGHASPANDLHRLADESGLAVAYQGRKQIEDRLGHAMTDAEWDLTRPHLDGFDTFVDKSIGQDTLAVWRDHVLDRAGFEHDDELGVDRIPDSRTD